MNEELIPLIDKLCQLSSEREWVEFKSNHEAPERVGEYISALSNSACLYEADEAYLIFGIDDKTHKVVGTKYKPHEIKGKGHEDLIPWLMRNLNPDVEFSVKEVDHPNGRVIVFRINPALTGPVRFLGKSWIRIESYNKSLESHPEMQALIWDRRKPFEERIAKDNVSEEEVLKLLNYDVFFQLMDKALPKNHEGIIESLVDEGLLKVHGGILQITNLGAIVLARDLLNFTKLAHKSVRVITYRGKNKLDAVQDVTFEAGYAVIFKELLTYIESQIPKYEKIRDVMRIVRTGYPREAIREFVANALIHQDFYISGTNPLIEIYDDRVEIYNPGNPLIKTDRFIDKPPRSRNEKLADLLRMMKVCERRGSGVDRAVAQIEIAKLPAPNFESQKEGIKVTMFSKRDLTKLTEEEKRRACYLHSCLKYAVDQEPMTNKSLCLRFGIKKENQSIASRIIKSTLAKGLIKPFDPENTSSRYIKYLPYWA